MLGGQVCGAFGASLKHIFRLHVRHMLVIHPVVDSVVQFWFLVRTFREQDFTAFQLSNCLHAMVASRAYYKRTLILTWVLFERLDTSFVLDLNLTHYRVLRVILILTL